MQLIFNGREYPVNDTSLSMFFDVIYGQFFKQYEQLDIASKVLMMPFTRGLAKKWMKNPTLADFGKIEKKDDTTLKLAEMILYFAEIVSRQGILDIALDDDGNCDLKVHHPYFAEEETVDTNAEQEAV